MLSVRVSEGEGWGLVTVGCVTECHGQLADKI